MSTISDYFERKTRDNGEQFYTLVDDQPGWLYDAVMEAHDDELPNDWRYDTCFAIVSTIEDGAADAHEIADGLVDVYTADLIAWLGDHPGRTSYCDERMTDGSYSSDSVEDVIRAGQFLAIANMAEILLEAIAESGEDES